MLEGVAPLTPKSRAAAAEEEEEEELEEEGAAAAAAAQDRAPRRLLVKLLVPQPLCGIIIGKNGVTIRQFAADTGTSIRSARPDFLPSMLPAGVVAADSGPARVYWCGARCSLPQYEFGAGGVTSQQATTAAHLPPPPERGICPRHRRVTSPDGHASNVSHRIVTIGGLQDSVLKAIALMVSWQQLAAIERFQACIAVQGHLVARPWHLRGCGGCTSPMLQDPKLRLFHSLQT